MNSLTRYPKKLKLSEEFIKALCLQLSSSNKLTEEEFKSCGITREEYDFTVKSLSNLEYKYSH